MRLSIVIINKHVEIQLVGNINISLVKPVEG